MRYLIVCLMIAGLFSGCASKPVFDTSDVDISIIPSTVIGEPQLSMDKRVIWGGTILDIQNLKDSTRIEVLSYPLSSSYRPQLHEKPLGRFIIRHSGYLEPKSFAQGRIISVVGKVGKTVSGKVGDSDYSYPLVNAQQLQLWSAQERTRTNFQFGIGIRL